MSCGISKSGFLNDEAERFEKWLKNNYHGTMSYMERNFDKRLDTTKLVEGSKSVISLLFNYYPKKKQNPNSYKISKYAYGLDCLLYTSPSPRDAHESRMPSSA